MDARGYTNTFAYDAAGQRIEQTDPLDRVTTTAYDAAGRETLRVDARGNVTTFTFDGIDQLTGRQYPDGTAGCCHSLAPSRTLHRLRSGSRRVDRAADCRDRGGGSVRPR